MKTLYLDCGMGAAGDMLSAALIELLPDPDKMTDCLNGIGIPGVRYALEPSVKCGIKGSHMTVTVNGAEEDEAMHAHAEGHLHDYSENADVHGNEGHHHDHAYSHDHTHNGIADIEHIVKDHLDLPENVRTDILEVFAILADAESKVHGVPVTDIHFHEVGTMDAVADIAAVCMIMDELKPDEVVASPVHVGCGQVKCAHGILPVPAPATANILQGIPTYGGSIKGELCTPTGAALLKHFVTRFGEMPVMKADKIGYGMGKKDFEAANCVRAIIGETCGAAVASNDKTDTIIDLSCNVDDMTPEAVGFAMDKLYEGGALEVFTLPAGMKKNRPGTLIHVFCRPENREGMVRLIFKHTTTIGIREAELGRYVLERRIETVDTPYGTVRKKVSEGYGVRREKYEYDDLSRIANEQGLSINELLERLDK